MLGSASCADDGVVLSPPMALPGADDPTPRIFAFITAHYMRTFGATREDFEHCGWEREWDRS